MNDEEAKEVLDQAQILGDALTKNAPTITSEINNFLLTRAGSLSDSDRQLLTEGIKQGISIAYTRLLKDCYEPLLNSMNVTNEKIARKEVIEGDAEAVSSMNAGSLVTLSICAHFGNNDMMKL